MFNGKDVIRPWVLENSKEIKDALVKRRSQAILDTTFPELFDPSARTLSEMHLCGAMMTINLPEPYRSVHGTISLKGNVVYEHTYGFNRQTNSLIDFVAGQFFVSSGMDKGEAINGLIALAPDLFTITGEVAVLHGSVDLIRNKLGIHYS